MKCILDYYQEEILIVSFHSQKRHFPQYSTILPSNKKLQISGLQMSNIPSVPNFWSQMPLFIVPKNLPFAPLEK